MSPLTKGEFKGVEAKIPLRLGESAWGGGVISLSTENERWYHHISLLVFNFKDNMKKPELLAPAGDFEKLKTAIHYGADAVYLGDSRFSLRGKAGNFNPEELREAVNYSHKHDKRYTLQSIFSPIIKTFQILRNI